ncbi:hypothetical protein SCHPADRAFT_911965 [Schizopora paradoxa]|uniref:Uncharacterized protein n=1 Tax=Schizopora paradoxa TaxID=27342 RepID=A0A0H2QW83_9AGAM|nr:hypothetical protein SCHPADRAFT_911965 [Schizopora paradoxa]
MLIVNIKYLPSRSRSGWRSGEGAQKGERSCVKRPVVEIVHGSGRERIWFKRAVWEKIESRLACGEHFGDSLRGFATRWDAFEDAYIHVFASTLRSLTAGKGSITLSKGLLSSQAAVKQAVEDARSKLEQIACKQVSLLPESIRRKVLRSAPASTNISAGSSGNPPVSRPTSGLASTPTTRTLVNSANSDTSTTNLSNQALFRACEKPLASSLARPTTSPSASDTFLQHIRQLQSALLPRKNVPNVLSDALSQLISSNQCWSPAPAPSQDRVFRSQYFICECLRAVRRYSLVAPEVASALSPSEEEEEEAMSLCKEIRHRLEQSGLYTHVWDDNQVLSYWIATNIFV